MSETKQGQSQSLEDPCGEFGATQRAAALWMCVVIIVGLGLTFFLTGVDRKFYDSKGQFLDYSLYKDNRSASTSIGSEQIDERTQSAVF